MEFNRILIIQTAFIGDVILATPVIERLKNQYPESKLDFLLRKGNETLLKEDPRINQLYVWDKKGGKYRQLWKILGAIRKKRYDLVVNLQRFASMGFVTCFSKATMKVGFDKSPFAFSFDLQVRHSIEAGKHEVQRNLDLVAAFVDEGILRPSLHLSDEILKSVEQYKGDPFITLAPTSVWFTKQYPLDQWLKLLRKLKFEGKIYLLGAPSDMESCEWLENKLPNKNIRNLCGKVSLLQSAALMKDAVMNYVNDSAPMHLASAVNAPVTAIYCSTIPDFGFGPLSDESHVVEVSEDLDCRPCGLHGYKKCPRGHFKCAYLIDTDRLASKLTSTTQQG